MQVSKLWYNSEQVFEIAVVYHIMSKIRYVHNMLTLWMKNHFTLKVYLLYSYFYYFITLITFKKWFPKCILIVWDLDFYLYGKIGFCNNSLRLFL